MGLKERDRLNHSAMRLVRKAAIKRREERAMQRRRELMDLMPHTYTSAMYGVAPMRAATGFRITMA